MAGRPARAFGLIDVDGASAALILQLYNQDIEDIQAASKGKGKEGELSDADRALEILQDDVRSLGISYRAYMPGQNPDNETDGVVAAQQSTSRQSESRTKDNVPQHSTEEIGLVKNQSAESEAQGEIIPAQQSDPDKSEACNEGGVSLNFKDETIHVTDHQNREIAPFQQSDPEQPEDPEEGTITQNSTNGTYYDTTQTTESDQDSEIDDCTTALTSLPSEIGDSKEYDQIVLQDGIEAVISASSPRLSHVVEVSYTCTCCLSDVYRSATIPLSCNHNWCNDCVQDLFEHCTRDESLFPPSCCKIEISLELAKTCLKDETTGLFQKKQIEFGTPLEHRKYCHRVVCRSFIPPELVQGEVAMCDGCGVTSCATCDSGPHHGECTKDLEDQDILDLAKQEGWRRCKQCGTLIMFSGGCNHMT